MFSQPSREYWLSKELLQYNKVKYTWCWLNQQIHKNKSSH